MATAFLLGPSEWRQAGARPTPMDVRRELKAILEARNHRVLLMEDLEDAFGEDLVDKFERILDASGIDYVVVYWPKGAKMQTTYDELLLLRKRMDSKVVPPVWILHHDDVLKVDGGEFKLLETGERSRYLEAAARLGAHANPWKTPEQLREFVRRLAAEL